MERDNYTIALLIDAENESKYIGELLAELSERGRVIYRQVYGKIDGAGKLTVAKWKAFEKYGCIIFGHSSTKENATDIRLIAGAIDLIHEKEINEICIMSGDGDYLPLISVARAKGVFTVVASEQGKLSKTLRNVCDKVILLGKEKAITEKKGQEETSVVNLGSAQEFPSIEDLKEIVIDILHKTEKSISVRTICTKIYSSPYMKEKFPEFRFGKGGAKAFFEKNGQDQWELSKGEDGTLIGLKKGQILIDEDIKDEESIKTNRPTNRELAALTKKILREVDGEVDLGTLCKKLYSESKIKEKYPLFKFEKGEALEFFSRSTLSVRKNAGGTYFVSLKEE